MTWAHLPREFMKLQDGPKRAVILCMAPSKTDDTVPPEAKKIFYY